LVAETRRKKEEGLVGIGTVRDKEVLEGEGNEVGEDKATRRADYRGAFHEARVATR
jgi:hypothetical protein